MNDNLIVKNHYRTLRAIYDTQTRSYEELLHLSGKKKIHTQNLQILMVEVYKCLNNISPPFTWDYFKQKNTPYHLRNTQLLELSKCRTKTYGLKIQHYLRERFYRINCCQTILRKQNPLYISKIKFRNRQGDHALVVSALELSTFKKCTYVKFFLKKICNYCFYMLVSWFLLVQTCLTYDTMYVLSNYK